VLYVKSGTNAHWIPLVVILAALFSAQVIAQSTDGKEPSLGEVARKNQSVKKSKDPSGKPKIVVNDEDDSALRKSPIPAIALDGPDNVEEILNAIHDYRSKHNPAETEDAVHFWFDEQNQILSAAIDSTTRLQKDGQMKMENAQDHVFYVPKGYPVYYSPDFDPQKYNDYLTGQRMSQRVDTRNSQASQFIISRIQQAFMRVRADVICHPNKVQPSAYDWFTIRTAN